MRPTFCEGRRRARRFAARSTLLLVALLPACATLTVGEELQLGSRIAQQMRQELVFVQDEVVLEYVADIGGDIVRAAGPQPFPYHFSVVEDDEINAFAGPAGYVYVHTETILRARNASELAGVLGHEIGHVALRHIAQNYEQRRNAGTLHQAGVLAASVFGYGSLANLGGGLATMAVLNSFTREDEREADEFAIRVLPEAGYDPNGLLTFLDVVKTIEPAGRPGFLSSHPATEERMAETRALIASTPPAPGLKVTDRGRLGIIQRRIRLLTGKERPKPTGLQPL